MFKILLFTLLPITVCAQTAFTDVSISSGIDHRTVFYSMEYPASGGAAWFDYDMDGDEDLYLTGGAIPDALYSNEGDGMFVEVTAAAGLATMDNSINTMGVVTGDIDNDGFREIFITTEKTDSNRLFYNNGDGTFTDISVSAGVFDGGNSASASFGDYNLDGYLDLYVTNWCVEMNWGSDTFPVYQNYLYHNNGDLTFTEVSASLGVDEPSGCSLGVLFTDYDNDHDLDIMVANDFGDLPGNNENALYRNDYPTIGFTDVSVATSANFGMNGMGMAHGDYDEDGDMDYYITNIRSDVLLRNNGSGFSNEISSAGLENDTVSFLDLSGYRASVSWGCGFFDYDNDTDLDLFVANGDLKWGDPWGGHLMPCLDTNKLYSNNADGTFTNISLAAGIADTYISRGFAYCDYDGDGDVDMLVGISDSILQEKHSFLYRNNLESGNWLEISLVGIIANRDGFGARVEVMFNGRTLIREVDGGSSYESHNSSIVHFGLDDVSTLDTVRVIWPGGYTDEFYQIGANQHLLVTEQNGYSVMGSPEATQPEFAFKIYPNPVTALHFGVQLNTKVGGDYKLTLYDSMGRVLMKYFKEDVSSGSIRWELNLPCGINSGIYHLALDNGAGRKIKKLSVLR